MQAVVILDEAGWHQTKSLKVPGNISLLRGRNPFACQFARCLTDLEGKIFGNNVWHPFNITWGVNQPDFSISRFGKLLAKAVCEPNACFRQRLPASAMSHIWQR